MMSKLNLDLYQGRWYEIGKYPNYFELECTGSTADYYLTNGNLQIINLCYKNKVPIKIAIGTGRPTDDPNSLSVNFTINQDFRSGPLPIQNSEGLYEVLWTDYRKFSFVKGGPDYFWILSRNQRLNYEDIQFINNKTKELGYDNFKVQINSDVL